MKIISSFLVVAIVLVGCSSKDSLEAHDLFEDGKYKEAAAAYETYLTQNAPTVNVLYNQGRSYQELGEFDKAEANFMQVIKIDQNHTNSILGLAQVYYAQGNYNKSSVNAQLAIDKSSNNAKAFFILGRSLHHLGYFNEALEAYNSCITYNKKFGEAYLYRGAIKIAKNTPRSACEDFQTAKRLKVKEADKAVKDYCG